MAPVSPCHAADFAGHWHITRRIMPRHGLEVRFEGQAVWTPVAGGMDYHETGQMMMAEQPPMQAERRYFWSDDLSVYFDDGRFFHKVPPSGGAAVHWCDPDQYEGLYDFSDWPAFRVVWQVRGPIKDYRSETDYTRL